MTLRLFFCVSVLVGVCAGSAFANPGDTPFEAFSDYSNFEIVATPTDGGIRENVPKKYQARYDSWKAELLSTDFGKNQWQRWADDKNFVLTITVTGDKEKGAGTSKFQWNDSGELVGATITLGGDIEDGYPSPIYYPVLSSLSVDAAGKSISGEVLAATKLSHEIGHVEQAAKAKMSFLQLQNKLMPEYNSIFLKNGMNPKDSKLVELADEMQGTPVEIWESREYWSEVTAMEFLSSKISTEPYYCGVFKSIRRNVESYAAGYEDRFLAKPEFKDSPCWK